jgi:hypothetical protein
LDTQTSYTAFAGTDRIAHGDLCQVARMVKTLADAREPRSLLVFAHPSGRQVDLDLRGTVDQVLERLETPAPARPEEAPARRSPGRPKLGVVGREVTLLPRHWEWLNAQPGGASVALRKLVEQARRDLQGTGRMRQSREAAFRFMSAIAGNEPGFEEASRALFAGNREGFETQIKAWPHDVRDFVRLLAVSAF